MLCAAAAAATAVAGATALEVRRNHINTRTHPSTYVCIYKQQICVHTYVIVASMDMPAYIFIYGYMYIYVWLALRLRICMQVCLFVCIYIYVCMRVCAMWYNEKMW